MSSVVLKSNNLNSVNSNLNNTNVNNRKAAAAAAASTNSYYLHANETSRRKDLPSMRTNNTLSYRQANSNRPVEMRISNNENRVPAQENNSIFTTTTTTNTHNKRATQHHSNQYAARPARANMNISNRRNNPTSNENREQQANRAPTQSNSPRAVDNSSSYVAMNSQNSNFANQYVPTIDQIIPRLYISDDIAARNRRMLDEKSITHILNLTTNIPNKFEPEITYKKFIIFDMENQNIDQYFDEAFEFIDNALKNEKNAVLGKWSTSLWLLPKSMT